MIAIPRTYVSSETSTRKRGVHKVKCSNCNEPLEPHRLGKQAYCLKCHAEYMRMHRPKHSQLSDEQRKKANSRSYLNTNVKRGKIEKKPCETCGSSAEAHHNDYSKPLEVQWFCRPCHLQWHRINTIGLEADILQTTTL